MSKKMAANLRHAGQNIPNSEDYDSTINNFNKSHFEKIWDEIESIESYSELVELNERTKVTTVSDMKCFFERKGISQGEVYVARLLKKIDEYFAFNEKSHKKQILSHLNKDIGKSYQEQMAKLTCARRMISEAEIEKYHQETVKFIEKNYRKRSENIVNNFLAHVIEQVNDSYQSFIVDIKRKLPEETDAIGIDLGTTFSSIGYLKPIDGDPRKVYHIPDEFNKYCIPSVVHVTENGGMIIGRVARDQLMANPGNTIRSVKRIIGMSLEDYEQDNITDKFWPYTIQNWPKHHKNPRIYIETKQMELLFTPEQISARILKYLVERAEEYFGRRVTKAVISVPAFFNSQQKLATKIAAEDAGIEVLKLITEPAAAALAYSVDITVKKKYV